MKSTVNSFDEPGLIVCRVCDGGDCCGGLGQLACQYAKSMGFRVIGVDINDSTLSTMKSQDADGAFMSHNTKDYAKEAQTLMYRGPNKSADAAHQIAHLLLSSRGLIMVVGFPAKGVPFNALDAAIETFKVRG
ncbi:hypothetical protein K504DRAFT_493610 [Pleomassaria siparia CBS 279.74]|uniref:Alcohol dehydrogenase-like C-terminal domain-containing protein n=1 Tax=Pleomassaria siparia CBS 279.74 TaxID=1314801 RepID=A0A6G1JZN4_9PLEO|nr:hypothetical protein K504DRAFT_493610 [Pleomassaria siparia CBS 279.74]